MAVNFCQLGKLYFTSTVQEPLTSNNLMPAPTSTSTERGVYLVEHALINRAGLLQATGRKLRTRTLTITLRQNFCNVQNSLLYLDFIMYQYKAVPLIWGNGLLDGNYLIENISETDNEFFEDGALIACDLTVQLKEFVDAEPLKRVQQENRDKAVAVGDKKSNVVRGRSNKATCQQNMAKAMQVIESNSAVVDKAIQNYASGATQNDAIVARLQVMKSQINTYVPFITGDPESCIYHDLQLFDGSQTVVTAINYVVADLNANVIVPGSFNKQTLQTHNLQLQQAVRTLKRVMQPYINKTISRG